MNFIRLEKNDSSFLALTGPNTHSGSFLESCMILSYLLNQKLESKSQRNSLIKGLCEEQTR